MNVFWCIVIFAVLNTVEGVGKRCKMCDGVPSMAECTYVTTCADDEECYARKSVGIAGNVVYQSGCISTSVCKLVNSPVKRLDRTSRDSVSCFQCCDSDLCNNNLCSGPQTSINRGLQCFSCQDVIRPEHCRELKTCGSDYECETTMYNLQTINQIRYRLGCLRKTACQAIEGTLTTDSYCVKCCNTSYCNAKLCGFLSKALPMVTSAPQDRQVLIGDVISLQCLVAHIQSLPFTVTWQHQAANHAVTHPPVTYSSENQIVRMTITRDHYGIWTCTVRNKNGVVSKSANVFPPIPSSG